MMEGGDDAKSVTIWASIRGGDKIIKLLHGKQKTSVGYQYHST